MTEQEISVKLTETEQRAKSNTHRIEKLEQQQKDLNKLVTAVEVLASREKGDDSAVLALFGEIKKHNAARYFASYDEINRYVAGVLTSGALALYTGAGTINRAAEKLVSDYGDTRE